MSVFSSKKARIVVVQSQSFNVVNEKTLHKYSQSAVLQAVLTNQNISDVLRETLINGGGIKLRNFINWAEYSGYNEYIGEIFPRLTYTNMNSQAELGIYLATEIPDWKSEFEPLAIKTHKDLAITVYLKTGVWTAEKQAVYEAIKSHPERFEYLITVYNDQSIKNTQDLPIEVYSVNLEGDTYTVKVHWKRYSIVDKSVVESGSYEDETYILKGYDTAKSYIWLSVFHIRVTRVITSGKPGSVISPPKYSYTSTQNLIYKCPQYPTGNPILDELFGKEATSVDDLSKFASVIPLRYWNHTIDKKGDPDTYKWCKKAVRKLFSKQSFYDELLDNLNSNSQIGSIDFAYLHLGIPINCKDPAAISYIYNFFDVMYRMTDPKEVPLLDIGKEQLWSIVTSGSGDNPTTIRYTTESKEDPSTAIKGLRIGLDLNLRTGAKANYNYNLTVSFSRILKEIHNINSDYDYPKDENGEKRKIGSSWITRTSRLGSKLVKFHETYESGDHIESKEVWKPYYNYRSGLAFYKLISDKYYVSISVFDLGQDNLIFENKSDVLDAWIEINPYTYTPEPNMDKNLYDSDWHYESKENILITEENTAKNLKKAKQNQSKNKGYSAFLIPLELHAVRNTGIGVFTDASQYAITSLFNLYEIHYIKVGGFFSDFMGLIGAVIAVVGLVLSIIFPTFAPIGQYVIAFGVSITLAVIDNPILSFISKVVGAIYAGASSWIIALIAVAVSYVVEAIIPGPLGAILGAIAGMAVINGLGTTSAESFLNNLSKQIMNKLQDPMFILDSFVNAVKSIFTIMLTNKQETLSNLQAQGNNLLQQQQYLMEDLQKKQEDLQGKLSWSRELAKQHLIVPVEPPEMFLSRTLLNEPAELSISALYNQIEADLNNASNLMLA